MMLPFSTPIPRDNRLFKGFVCSFTDPATYKIKVGKRSIHFEFGERFGPLVVTALGYETRQPGHSNDFWRIVSLWFRQSKRVDDDGWCVWDEPTPPTLNRWGKVIKQGDDHWGELGSLPVIVGGE